MNASPANLPASQARTLISIPQKTVAYVLRHPSFPGLIAAALGIFNWAVFRPAIMSPDSLAQLEEALANRYSDLHPAIMAIMLHWSFRFGGLSRLMLCQSVAGTIGVFALANSVLRLLNFERRSPADPWIAVGILTFLLIPLSPLAFYLMTFWGDAWVAVALVWVSSLLLETRQDDRSGPRTPYHIIALAVLCGFCCAIRHNAIAMLPFLVAMVYKFVSGPRVIRCAASFLALISFYAFYIGIPRALGVEHSYRENMIMGSDLIGLCAQNSSTCNQLPYTKAHLNGTLYKDLYRFGDDHLVWNEPLMSDRAYMNVPASGPPTHPHGPAPQLRAEYRRTIIRFPLELAVLKIKAFCQLLSLRRPTYWIHQGISDNPHGLRPRDLTNLSEVMYGIARRVVSSRHAYLLFGIHLSWLIIDIFLVGLFAFRDEWRIAGTLLVCVSYYFSYLVATPGNEFRYLYPASLVVQTIALSFIFAELRRVRQRPITKCNAAR